MRAAYVLGALLLLAACGGDSSPPSPTPVPTPVPIPNPLPSSSGWAITHWGANGVASPAAALPSPVFAIPQCGSASTCWISYVESVSGPLSGKSALTLSYSVTGDSPVFVHDSGRGNPNSDNTVGTCALPPGGTLRLLIHGAYPGRWFSKDWWELKLGPNTVSVPLSADKWIDADSTGNFGAALATPSTIGLGLGGGCFAAHGVAVSSGSATITVGSYGAQ